MSSISRLVVSKLKKSFKSRPVVREVSLELESGQVIGLLGPNGAGKTTSFYMIVGLVKPDSGSIFIDDHDITPMPIHLRSKRGLAYLPQEASVFRKMTVEENILAILQIKNHNDSGHLQSLLDDLNIDHIRSSKAEVLSGGERRRVEIARVLATKPCFVLLDEPFAGVDPIAVSDIQNIIRFLSSKNIGVLITDHNVRETLRICHHAYIINEGSILADGSPRDLVDSERVRQIYLGDHFNF